MPFKTFTPSQLTSNEVNTYLMQQVVATFADATDRASQLTAPLEGQVTYLQDVKKMQYWNGTSWIAVGAGSSSTYTLMEIGP